MPDHILIGRAENGGDELLDCQRSKRRGGRQHGHNVVIDYGDLRSSAARGVGEGGGADGDRVRCGNGARRLIVHLQIVAGREWLTGIAGHDANLADGAVAISNAIDRPGHRIVGAAENLSGKRDAMIAGARDRAGRKRHANAGLNRYRRLRFF